MSVIHRHHIIPRHAGGTDDATNIVELTIPEHAEAHRQLWETYGREEDYIAYLGLSNLREEHAQALGKKYGPLGGANARRIAVNGVTYDSIKQAARALGVSRQLLLYHLHETPNSNKPRRRRKYTLHVQHVEG